MMLCHCTQRTSPQRIGTVLSPTRWDEVRLRPGLTMPRRPAVTPRSSTSFKRPVIKRTRCKAIWMQNEKDYAPEVPMAPPSTPMIIASAIGFALVTVIAFFIK